MPDLAASARLQPLACKQPACEGAAVLLLVTALGRAAKRAVDGGCSLDTLLGRVLACSWA